MQNRVIVIFVICLFKSIVINATIYAEPLKITLEELLAGATIEIVPCQPYSGACYDAPCQYAVPSYPGCPVFYDPLSSPCGMPLYPWAPIYDSPSCCCQYPQCGCQYGIPPPPTCADFCCACGPYPAPCNPSGQCDFCPSCSCYFDNLNPCAIFEDASSTYICFNKCGCDCTAPCIYFPEVEYPVNVRDIKPYYSGSCWCS